jgi:hypothetical protein
MASANVVWVGRVQIKRVSRQVLLPESHHARDCLPNRDIASCVTRRRVSTYRGTHQRRIVADARGRRHRPGVGRNRLRNPAEARVRRLTEGASLQAKRTVEQHVVVDDVFIVQTYPAADHRLAIVSWIPRETKLRSKVLIRLVDRISHPRECGIQFRNRGQVAVGTAAIPVIPQADGEREVGFDLSVVPKIEGESVVRAQSTRREAQRRLQRRVSQPIPHPESRRRIVQGIRNASGIAGGSGCGRRVARIVYHLPDSIGIARIVREVKRKRVLYPGNAWSKPKEAGESTTLDVIESHPVTQEVVVNRLAPIVLELVVRLGSALRGIRIWPRVEPVT